MPVTCAHCGHVHDCASVSDDDVQAVWDAWAASVGRDVRSTRGRRDLIRRRLREWPRDDLVAAVQGWQHSPFHSGDNPEGRVWNDLELLLRNEAHIEQFMALTRGQLNGHRRPHRVAARFQQAVGGFLEGRS